MALTVSRTLAFGGSMVRGSRIQCVVIRNLSKSVSACQSQHQPVRPYGQQQQLKQVISPATAAVIQQNHIVDSGVPEVYIPDVTLDEFIWADVDKWSSKIAMECGISGRKYTYGQCRLMTKRFASALIKSGLKHGNVIALVLPNVPEFPISFLGANAAGLIVTIINPMYTPEEIAKQLQDAQVKSIVTISMFVPLIRASISRLENFKDVIVIGEPEEGCHSFMEMMKDDGSAYAKFKETLIRDPKTELVALPYSSGTTGKPKGVMLTHYNMIANICTGSKPDWCNFHETTDDFQEVFGVVLPFFHIYSLNAILLGGLRFGAKVICLPRFEPSMFIKMLADYKPTFLHTVPPLLNFVATSPDIKTNYLERVHTVISGGAPAGMVLIEKILNRFSRTKPLFQEGYGLTETSPVVSMLKSSSGPSKLGSCGTPIPMTQLAVIDTTTGDSLGPNKTGELYIRGPQVMKGYWRNEDATQETMDGEWLKTGDVAYYDDDGHLYVVDRIKELIKVKGFQVAPSELEDLLRKHPSVQDCAVIGIPDEAAGELPRAYIVSRPNTTTSATDINSYLEAKVTPYKQLKGGVVFIDAIPRNPGGKILRKDLRALANNSPA